MTDYIDPFTAAPRWPDNRACAGKSAEVFFQGRGGRTAAAKAICRTCPALDMCQDWALQQPWSLLFGVWGGLSQTDRKHLDRVGQEAA